MLFGFIIGGLAAYWVSQDAKKRGMNPVGWAIFVFLILIIGLPAYFITRKPLVNTIDTDGFGKGDGEEV